MADKRIAIVHEWLDTIGGSEKVVDQFLHLYPDADLYSLVDFLPANQRSIIHDKPVTTSFIQNLPFARKNFRNYLALMPLAVEQFDLSAYPLVLSSSHAVAKGIIPTPGQIHISYVHTPIRYAWDLQQVYLKNSNLTHGLKSWLARSILHYIRNWDSRTANGVDELLANSRFTAQRIWKYYRRESKVIYPPVDVEAFALCEKKQDYFLTVSRLVHYKAVDVLIEAFRQMPDLRLMVVGDGPLYSTFQKDCPTNVTLAGWQEKNAIVEKMQQARALVYAAREDFGIVPVEAQACGTPVIAYGSGGVLESVRPLGQPEPTGLFFDRQSPESIIHAVRSFSQEEQNISASHCRQNASRFSVQRFRDEIQAVIQQYL